MGRRLQLQTLLESFAGAGFVHFQPPPSVYLKYPCIIYNRDYIQNQHADNAPYRSENRYTITVITEDPDSELPGKISQLPKTIFVRGYKSDQLNHDVFNTYF